MLLIVHMRLTGIVFRHVWVAPNEKTEKRAEMINHFFRRFRVSLAKTAFLLAHWHLVPLTKELSSVNAHLEQKVTLVKCS